MFFSVPRRGLRRRIAPPKRRQAPGRFIADKPGERLSYQRSFLFDPGVLFGLPDQFVVKSDGCAH
jgi:hypothetical protein